MEPNAEPNPLDPLAPQLQEAEATLERALEEACEARPLADADTGELIRIEEMLSIASDAAKRAISIRRKRRQRPRRGANRIPDDVAASSAADAVGKHRHFADEKGERWDVWAVYPQSRGSPLSVLRGTYREGWLCLESATQKRRLSPIPPNWDAMTEEQLRELRDRADVVLPRGS